MDNNLEMYRQRYETWRHLDKLRWQMLQLLVAIGTALALVLQAKPDILQWWFWVLVGFSVLSIGVIMHRISSAIRANGTALKKYGNLVGDDMIPDVSDASVSVGQWVSIVVGFAGIAMILQGLKIYT